jgi:hypothetical protein
MRQNESAALPSLGFSGARPMASRPTARWRGNRQQGGGRRTSLGHARAEPLRESPKPSGSIQSNAGSPTERQTAQLDSTKGGVLSDEILLTRGKTRVPYISFMATYPVRKAVWHARLFVLAQSGLWSGTLKVLARTRDARQRFGMDPE